MGTDETSETFLSPKRLAEALGVSESSVKRWVDGGRIRAARTVGGHRRIAAGEAIRFLRDTGSPLVRPELLGIADLGGGEGGMPAAGEEAKTLHRHLRAGAAAAARGLMVGLYARGWSIARIVDGPLRAALARLGEEWRREKPGIYREHRATDIAIQAVSRLRLLQQVPAEAPRAVGGAPSGDRYILPSLCAAAVLESRGLAAINLGPETPLGTLRLAVDDLDARLVWLSVSSIADRARLVRSVARLRRALAAREVPLVVGGSAAGRLGLAGGELIYIGSSMAELEALVLGLRLGAAGSHS